MTDLDDAERLARVALTRIAEPGDEGVGRWLAEHGAREVVRAVCDGGTRLPGVSERYWDGLRRRARCVRPEADLAAVGTLGGRFVCPGDEEWPCQLDDLGQARPYGLWLRGSPSLRFCALRSVAVVGARACSDYGGYVASGLAAGLARRGWTVVSGAAYGVDGAAHRGALAAGGVTVGVLACGVDVSYPPGHGELIGRMSEQGLLVAELPPQDHPTRARFLLRNRVIAALTRGTVVVEAQVRSGSLVTARRARDLGRVVMGIPGPVTSGLSAGVHQLLRHEGELVTSPEEVIELVGGMGELAPEPSGPVLARDLLPPEATRMLEALPACEPLTTAELAQRTDLPPGTARARLHELRSLGFAASQGDRWRLVPGGGTRAAPAPPGTASQALGHPIG